MARKFPEFIYSNPKNTKSKGPFIVHTVYPQFICRIVDDVDEMKGSENYYIHLSGWTLELLEVFADLKDGENKKVSNAMYDMLAWVAKQDFTK